EISFGKRPYLPGIHITHDADGDVRRYIICFVKLLRIANPQAGDVTGPATRHPAVWVCFKGRGHHRLHQLPLWIRLHPHAPLFHDYITLFVEFPEYGLQKALRFEVEPEFDT